MMIAQFPLASARGKFLCNISTLSLTFNSIYGDLPPPTLHLEAGASCSRMVPIQVKQANPAGPAVLQKGIDYFPSIRIPSFLILIAALVSRTW